MSSSNYFDLPFDLPESIYSGDYVIATYQAYGLTWETAMRKAGGFAAGQSVGTWLPLPGVTRAMVENYQARVIGCYPVPDAENITFMLRLAFPMHNFGGSLAMLLTALVGNDVSTALRMKLVDLEFVGNSLKSFHGPAQGIEGLRKITGVYDRPLILNMIKPCLGYSPAEGAALFYESGKGGVDLIKDDELHGSTDVSTVAGRVKAYNAAAKRIFEEQGRKPVYIVNISDRPSRMPENIKAAIHEGAQAVMVNFVTTGLDSLVELTEQFGSQVAFLAHYAGVGVLDHENQGIASPVILGKLARLSGADSVMVMYPGDKFGPAYFEYLRTIQTHRFEFGGFKAVMSSIGGGVTPLSAEKIFNDVGKDVILGVGGAIQGHPLGTEAGARAMLQAVKSAVAGEGLAEAAAKSPELAKAIKAWG